MSTSKRKSTNMQSAEDSMATTDMTEGDYMETIDNDNALSYVMRVIDSFPPDLKPLAVAVGADPKFLTWPASKGHHHAYACGLLVHTAEVLRNCLHLAGSFPNVDMNVVLMAALHHDWMKVKEYEIVCNADVATETAFEIVKTPYIGTLGHIYGAAANFQSMAQGLGTDQEYTNAVVHCILSHHGRQEWGSPVEPVTFEAWVLHAADMISAKGM